MTFEIIDTIGDIKCIEGAIAVGIGPNINRPMARTIPAGRWIT
jgi:hypothetical protein